MANDQGRERPTWKRRLAGAAWLAGWISILYLVASPWRRLGGLEDESLRWLEGFVLLAGVSVGFTLGRFGRDMAAGGIGRTHLQFLRFVLYPPALLTAAGLVVLSFLEKRGAIGVAVSGFLAYWAGLDLAFGAVPLLEGKDYSLRRPLEIEREEFDRASRGGADWIPPWERP